MDRFIRLKLALIVFGLLFLVFCMVIVVLISVYYDTYKYPNDYAIVFDASSSATKMYIYTWSSDSTASQITVKQLTTCFLNGNGIDKLTSKNDLVFQFNDCVQLADRTIPQDRKSRTHIGLAASGGMRLLNYSNSAKANSILSNIRDYFNATNFLFENSTQVEIISGIDEATDGWITTNYLLNKFSSNFDPLQTLGTIDLGEASTQIAFASSAYNSTYAKFYDNVEFNGATYSLYSNSYLCWGINQMFYIYQTYLIITNGYSSLVPSACYPQNAFINISLNTLLNSPCSNGLLFNYPSYIQLDLYRFNLNGFYTFYGLSNATRCTQEMSILFPKTNCSYGTSCTFNNVYQPSIQNRQFYAYSKFYEKFNNTEVLFSRKFTKDLNGFINVTNYICSLNYMNLTILNDRLAKMSLNDLLSTCFTNNYMIALLNQLGITSLDNVTIIDNINGNTFGWTYGYFLNQLGQPDYLTMQDPPRRLPNSFFIPAIIIASITTALCFFSIVMCIFFI